MVALEDGLAPALTAHHAAPHTQHTMAVTNIDSIHLPLYLYFPPLCDTIELLTFAIHSNPNGSA